MSDEQQDKILAKIRALLEKARNVAGTPEADAFNEKAFELIAKYGVDENEAMKKASINSDKLMAVKFRLSDAYCEQRAKLLAHIAIALHCSVIRLEPNLFQVWGVGRHIERVKLLHDLLAVQMVMGANKVTSTEVNVFDHRGSHSVKALRASYMEGFASAIGHKLVDIEAAAARQADRNFPHRDYALALQSDAERARNAMRKKYPGSAPIHRKEAQGDGFAAGYKQGSNTDLGQTRVGEGQRALA